MARVLVDAYACEPGVGGEPEVGWRWARGIAGLGHDVIVLTRSNNRGAIERSMAQLDGLSIHFDYIDLPLFLRALKKRTGQVGTLIYSALWQLAAARRAWHHSRRARIDVLHHVTFCNDRLFSGLAVAKRRGQIFVWGPIGGSTHTWPTSFPLPGGRSVAAFEHTRALLQTVVSAADPLLAITRRRAERILVYTQEAIEGIPRKYRGRTSVAYHIGVDRQERERLCDEGFPDSLVSQGDSLRVCTAGRLVHWKGFDLVIEACGVAARRGVPITLQIFGSGPYLRELEMLGQSEAGQRLRIDFMGRVPDHDDLLVAIRDSDIFAQPTLRDGPPVAILEAMSMGTAVVCFDHGATRELVSPSCGYLVPLVDRASAVASLASVFEWSWRDRHDLSQRSVAAREHAVANWSWAEVDRRIAEVYAGLGFAEATEET